ncbi:MFS transporter [Plantactinospora sp. S1510]|uniref:MFS transporter n=2 Tax=Plantactinospora alkalitolerans TaxID=2789879 RepID=A0ABS0GPK5_9ACTN|nr:MFS transporter [Plantactinospora alkalitolerans]
MFLAAGIWVLELTGSSSLAALTGLCFYAPTLLGPVLGALVDRLPRRPLIVWTHLLTAAVVLSLLTVHAEHQTWVIYAVMLGYGISFVLVDAGESALLPAALPPDALGGVNGLRVSAQEGVKLVAPLVGAGLFGWWGAHSVALLTAGTLTAAAGLYLLIRLRPPATRSAPAHRPDPRRADDVPTDTPAEPGPPERSSGRIRAGMRYLWTHPELRVTVLIGSITIAMSGLMTAALYTVVVEDLHRPATFVGVLSSAQGAGSMLGGLLVGRVLRVPGTLAVGVLGTGLVALGATAWGVPWWPAVVAGSLIIGIGLPWTLVAAVTAVQTRTPEAMLGRVAATANTLLFAPITIATPLGAALVLLDRRVPLVVATALCLGTALLAIRLERSGRTTESTGPATTGPATTHATERIRPADGAGVAS